MVKKGSVEFCAMEEFASLDRMVTDSFADCEKFDGGNKTAGTRLRKQLKFIKDKAQALRKSIVEHRAGM